ncbi:MAG: UDP-2,4-diacetamido-2,4,6-trideoxy-beta-L-altropyranose hydrolase [Spirochaetes bacterium]|nr:UDP-2,4-diacetamido-2,4,6-trideoxy-beta-L-altropyranose hydrolase [Spirochaetota bacterium]
MRSVLFRADGSRQIGYGHIMRCLVLARHLQSRKNRVLFLLNNDPFAITKMKENSIPYRIIDYKAGSMEDLEEMKRVLREYSFPVFIHDSYGIDQDYERQIRPYTSLIVAFDDQANRKLIADLLINQNYGFQKDYKNLSSDTKILAGTQYVLLRDEFKGKRKKSIGKNVRHILLTMGGSDPTGMTVKIISWLKKFIQDNKLILHILVNKNFIDLGKIIKESKKNSNIKIYGNVKNVASLFKGMDLAISAGGSTILELLYMGVPTLVVITAENQNKSIMNLHLDNYVHCLGWHKDVISENLKASLKSILDQYRIRERMFKKGRSLIDGQGIKRIEKMISLNVKSPLIIRRVKEEDKKILFQWANETLARRMSFSSDPISWPDHCQWFKKCKGDKNYRIYVLLDRNREKVGSERFEIKNREAIIGIAIDPKKRGMGYGALGVTLGAKVLFKERKEIKHIIALVKKENKASLRTFLKAGFDLDDEGYQYKGHYCYRLVKGR